MKILLAFAIIFAGLAGCQSKPKYVIVDPANKTNAPTSNTGFNKEHYIWESFNFTTNQVNR